MEVSNLGNPEIKVLERLAFGLFDKARSKNRRILYLAGISQAAYKIESEGRGLRITKVDRRGICQMSLPESGTGLGVIPDRFVGVACDLETAVIIEPMEWEVLYEQNGGGHGAV